MEARIAVLEVTQKHTEGALEKITKDVEVLTQLVLTLQNTVTLNTQRIEIDNKHRDDQLKNLVKCMSTIQEALVSDENAIRQAVQNSNRAIKHLRYSMIGFTLSLPIALILLSIFSPSQILKLIDILKGLYGI